MATNKETISISIDSNQSLLIQRLEDGKKSVLSKEAAYKFIKLLNDRKALQAFRVKIQEKGKDELKIEYDDVVVIIYGYSQIVEKEDNRIKQIDKIHAKFLGIVKNYRPNIEMEYYESNRSVLESRKQIDKNYINHENYLINEAKNNKDYVPSIKVKRENKILNLLKENKEKIIAGILVTSSLILVAKGCGTIGVKTNNTDIQDIIIDVNEPINTPPMPQTPEPIGQTNSVDLPVVVAPPTDNIAETKNYFTYEDQSKSDKAIFTKNRYGELIEKYAKKCGIDPNIILGIAVTESGNHEYGLTHGSMGGLMQIEISYWDGKELDYYDFDDNSYHTIKITRDAIQNVENNIFIGCVMCQNELVTHHSIPASVMAYNQGDSNMNKIFNETSRNTGVSTLEMRNNSEHLEWLDYTYASNAGDKDYVSHVFSNIGFGYETFDLKCQLPTGEIIKYTTGPVIPKEQQSTL